MRTGFDLLLQTLDVRQGDEIIMSAINIASMAEVARTHGLKIVPVDIDLTTLAPSPDAVRAAMSTRTRVVLIAQLFGARTSFAAYESVRASGALLIEDCAQAWGGGFTGSPEADASLFSFGPIKRRTALGGALVSFRDEGFAERCAAIEASYEAMTESWFLKRVGKYCVLKAGTAPLLYRVIHSVVQMTTGDAEKAIGAVARGFPAGELTKRLRRRPPQRMLDLLHRRLASSHDDTERIDANMHLLGRLPTQMVVGSAAHPHHYWLTPILVRDPEAAVKAFLPLGYDITRGATSLRVIRSDERATPNAEKLINHVLYLPPPWKISATKREQLARDIRLLCDAPI